MVCFFEPEYIPSLVQDSHRVLCIVLCVGCTETLPRHTCNVDYAMKEKVLVVLVIIAVVALSTL